MDDGGVKSEGARRTALRDIGGVDFYGEGLRFGGRNNFRTTPPCSVECVIKLRSLCGV